VVGVSRRLAEVLAENLAETPEEPETLPSADQVPAVEEDTAQAPSDHPPTVTSGQPALPYATDDGTAEEVRRCVLELTSCCSAPSFLRCGAKVPPEPHTAGVWLYADALLSGKLQLGDATLVMRAVALAQAEDQAPPDLLATLASDVARFV